MFSQITSPFADFVSQTDSVMYPGSDSIYIFNQNPGETISPSLVAKGPVAGPFDFEWSVYNSGTGSFEALGLVDIGVTESQRTALSEGGYMVNVSNGAGIDTSFIAWIFINNLLVEVRKTPDGRIGSYSCDHMALIGNVYPDTFVYYNTVSNEAITIESEYTFQWTSDNSELVIPSRNQRVNVDPNQIDNPPYKDTWFILTAVDEFGMSDLDSVYYESIQVKAEFSYLFYDKEDEKDFVDPSSTVNDAPLQVRFINESLNGATFEWIFLTDTISNPDIIDNEFTSDVEYTPEYTYYIPARYNISLIAESEEGCTDTFSDSITVIISELEVPNVFTPNGDDINDYFTVTHKSIRSFSIRIYSRGGRLVYKNDINDLYEWDGWNGNVLDTNRAASEGVYYYIIEAKGYDDDEYKRGVFRGSVHLFRGEK